ADEEERAQRGVDEGRVLPEPAETRAAREIALEHRTGVDVWASMHRVACLLLDPAVQLAQAVTHDVVIVVAAGVAGHRPRRLGAAVVHPHHDRASGAGEGEPAVAPLGGPARHVLHLACVAVREPVVERCDSVDGTQIRNAHEIETESVCLRPDSRFEGDRGTLDHRSFPTHRAYRMTSSAGGTIS